MNHIQIGSNYISCPESLTPFSKIIHQDEKLCYLDKVTRGDFVYTVLEEMGQQCGGMSYFWKNEERHFVLDGWVKGLWDCRPFSIIKCLSLILAGKYRKRDDVVPRNVMDFKDFMLNGSHNHQPSSSFSDSVPRLEHDDKAARERAERARDEAMCVIRSLLPNIGGIFA